MTISTVNALAVSARAGLARAVSPMQGRSADAQALPAQSLPAQRADEAARRRDRHAMPGADSSRAGADAPRGGRSQGDDAAARGTADPSDTKQSAATHGRAGAVSSEDRGEASANGDAEALDTGALVARFFDVLQAAAAAGSAAGRPGQAVQAGDPADGVDDPQGDRSSDEALADAGVPGSPAALDGPAMSMVWARSWPVGDGSRSDASGDADTRMPIGPRSPSGVEALGAPSADATNASESLASTADRPDGTHPAASVTAGSALAGAWPLFGPPAARPSARGLAEASTSRAAASDSGAASAPSTSSTASSKARLESSLLTGDPGSGLDRPRASMAASADSPSATGSAATPNGAASALWPWPSAGGGATSTPAVALPAGSPAEWRDGLSHALGDRLQLTLKQGADQAVIRLDPPMLGRIDLSIRQDGAALSVHLSASNPEVLRQLQAMGDGLRQDLSGRHAGDLTVTVANQPSGSNPDADARRHGTPLDDDATQAAPGRALAEADADGDHPADPRDARRRAFASLTRSGGAA